MATLQGAAVAAPTIQATKTPPAEGQAARVVSDIIPGRVPVPSSSATPGSVQQPLVQQQLQLQPLRPSSQPQSPQPGGEANRGMAAHHRILALNRAWEEKRTKKREGGLEGWDSDSSATASDSDEGDIIIPPKRKVLPPGRQPAQHSRATRAAQAAPSTPATRPPPPGQPLRRPSNVPAHLVVPSSSNKTPVPLPEYTWNPPPGSGRPDQKAGQPPARAHVAHRKLTAAELRAEARRFTDALVRKKLSTVGGGSGTPTRRKSTGEAAARAKASATPPVKSVAGAPPAKVSTATPPPKVPTATPPVKVSTVTPPVNAPGGGPLPSPTGEMRFTTPGELLARIRHAAPPSQTTPASALPPSAAAPAQLPNVDRVKGDDGSDWAVDASETEETDDNSDLMMLDEAPPGFEGIRPAKPISIEKVTKDKSSVLESSLDGRPYTMFYHSGPDGPREVGRGTIIPTGYNLHEPPLRYICPVRDCRRLLKNMIALGGHFTAAHKGGKFNDNRDGTLSLVDTYKNPVGYSPAIVISQKPLPSNSPPPVEPSIPPWSNLLKRGGNPIQPVQGGKGPKWVIGASGAAATPTLPSSPALKTAVQRPVQGTDDVISYLHSYLAKTHTVPDRPDIRFMEKLPRLRNLPAGWISHHRTSYLPIGLYASALAYLTGDEITGAGACTQNTGSASRLSDVCVALPSSLPADARKELTKLSTCVGCHYYSHLYRQRNACDWAGNELSLGGSVEKSKAASAADVPSKSATPVTSSGREDVVAGEATPPADAVLRPRTLASTREPRKKRPAPALPASVGRSFKAPKVSAVSTAQPDDAGLDEMEPWEFAPGRLTDDTGSENVAFSGAYLTNAQPVTVFQDVGINIIVVKPGSSNRWATETAKLRTCTVAAGKIKVKVAETTFQVGPNGAFVIQPGQTALVENKCYVDATVHCVTVKDYELSS